MGTDMSLDLILELTPGSALVGLKLLLLGRKTGVFVAGNVGARGRLGGALPQGLWGRQP